MVMANGDANNMEIDEENDNENILQMVKDWIQFAQLNMDSLDVESGYYSTQSSQDGDDIPSIEDFGDVISGLPCVHALCVIMEMRMDWVGFCSEYHMVAAYMRSYKGSVLPISDPSLWEKPNSDMLPPPLERGTGRPRKVRRRSTDENTTQQQKKCGKCRGSRPRNNPLTRVGVGIGVGAGVGVGMRGRGTRGGLARGGATRGSVAGGGAARARQQSTNNP
ncbi:hypothetical protein GIB67_037845 [Kingdonia uniflora]|uniref:Uncharacterized protein n=1 Tax=Kingdonia uniflora TaxID=39325 RepID=A0A7J7LGX3_9MAGN|nr:hypothetical protein GIB67_037845 [Kingdonia uniflora]